jgi:hypothetical protein
MKLVVTWSIILNVSIALGINWIYIGSFAGLQCAFQLTQAMMLTTILIALFIPCIVLNIIIYVKTRESIPSQHQLAVAYISTASAMLVHVNCTTLRRMELEAARVFIAGVTPLLVLPCPLLLFTLFHLVCLVVHPNADAGQCSNTIWLAPYFKQLVTLHAVVHPIVYLCRSKEFFINSSSSQQSNDGVAAVAVISTTDRRFHQQQRTDEELYG